MQLEREAGDGIEPSHGAFAEPGLTTWLPRHDHWRPSIINRIFLPAQWGVELFYHFFLASRYGELPGIVKV